MATPAPCTHPSGAAATRYRRPRSALPMFLALLAALAPSASAAPRPPASHAAALRPVPILKRPESPCRAAAPQPRGAAPYFRRADPAVRPAPALQGARAFSSITSVPPGAPAVRYVTVLPSPGGSSTDVASVAPSTQAPTVTAAGRFSMVGNEVLDYRTVRSGTPTAVQQKVAATGAAVFVTATMTLQETESATGPLGQSSTSVDRTARKCGSACTKYPSLVAVVTTAPPTSTAKNLTEQPLDTGCAATKTCWQSCGDDPYTGLNVDGKWCYSSSNAGKGDWVKCDTDADCAIARECGSSCEQNPQFWSMNPTAPPITTAASTSARSPDTGCAKTKTCWQGCGGEPYTPSNTNGTWCYSSKTADKGDWISCEADADCLNARNCGSSCAKDPHFSGSIATSPPTNDVTEPTARTYDTGCAKTRTCWKSCGDDPYTSSRTEGDWCYTSTTAGKNDWIKCATDGDCKTSRECGSPCEKDPQLAAVITTAPPTNNATNLVGRTFDTGCARTKKCWQSCGDNPYTTENEHGDWCYSSTTANSNHWIMCEEDADCLSTKECGSSCEQDPQLTGADSSVASTINDSTSAARYETGCARTKTCWQSCGGDPYTSSSGRGEWCYSSSTAGVDNWIPCTTNADCISVRECGSSCEQDPQFAVGITTAPTNKVATGCARTKTCWQSCGDNPYTSSNTNGSWCYSSTTADLGEWLPCKFDCDCAKSRECGSSCKEDPEFTAVSTNAPQVSTVPTTAMQSFDTGCASTKTCWQSCGDNPYTSSNTDGDRCYSSSTANLAGWLTCSTDCDCREVRACGSSCTKNPVLVAVVKKAMDPINTNRETPTVVGTVVILYCCLFIGWIVYQSRTPRR